LELWWILMQVNTWWKMCLDMPGEGSFNPELSLWWSWKINSKPVKMWSEVVICIWLAMVCILTNWSVGRGLYQVLDLVSWSIRLWKLFRPDLVDVGLAWENISWHMGLVVLALHSSWSLTISAGSGLCWLPWRLESSHTIMLPLIICTMQNLSSLGDYNQWL